MKVYSKSKEQEEFITVVDFNKKLDTDKVIKSDFTIDKPGFYNHHQLFRIQDAYITYFELKSSEDQHYDFLADQDIVGLFYILSGEMLNTFDDNSYSNHSVENSHNIFYWPNKTGTTSFNKNVSNKILGVYVTKDFFLKCISRDNDVFEKAMIKMSKESFWQFNPRHYIITKEMHEIINQIIHAKREGVFLKLFLEAKLKELLLLQIEASLHSTINEAVASTQKIAKEVHDIIKKDTFGKYTLKEIAEKLGTNVTTLQKSFKNYYYVSIFQYWNNLKFNESKSLLLKGKSVKQVSIILGYNNPHHFSTAFKKHFSITPTEFLNANS